MEKINKTEYEILKGLDDKCKWIARDSKDDELFPNQVQIYEFEPWKRDGYWTDEISGKSLGTNVFQFIQWEDEKPYSIAELIEEYESSKKTILHEDFDVDNLTLKELDGFKQTLKVIKESEETEVKKDLEWAKDEIRQIAGKFPTYHDERDDKIKKMASMQDVLSVLDQLDEPKPLLSRKNKLRNQVGRLINDSYGKPDEKSRIERQAYLNVHKLIDQLDEPEQTDMGVGLLMERIKELEKYNEELIRDNNELRNEIDNKEVLTPDWIDINKKDSGVHSIGYYVPIGRLVSLLVPKQEKVRVPQFVAGWLDDNIERYETVYSFIISLVEVFGDTVPEKVWTYASENPDTMARAYLDGYTVKK